jgi:stage II sporulation protein AA (anti-sigma F factor antagonist)
MQLQFRREAGCLLGYVSGELDLSSAAAFRDKVDAELRKLGEANLILNLKGLEFIDSTGLAVLLGRHKFVTYGGGCMVLSEVPPKVVSMLEMAGLDSIIPNARDDRDALRIIQNKRGGGVQ